MFTPTTNREGRIVDRLIDIVIVLSCMVVGPYGLAALNALPALPVA